MANAQPISLLDYLPAIYREEPFLGCFLRAFEELFSGLEEKVADIATFFDPFKTRADFLPWLASWTAFSLRFDLDETQQRAFVANIIPLYRERGTKRSLERLLEIFTVGTPTITEAASLAALQIGKHSTVGIDTTLGGGAPHFFSVTVRLPKWQKPEIQLRQIAIADALIELEKPAHTYFELKPEFPSMQIGVTSTIGKDTLLGTIPDGGEHARH
jgi:phage tail-like protein